MCIFFFFFKQKTAYEMRISDWSSDVCSSDLAAWELERQRDEVARTAARREAERRESDRRAAEQQAAEKLAAKQREEAVARDKIASELHPIQTPSPQYPIAAEQSGQ